MLRIDARIPALASVFLGLYEAYAAPVWLPLLERIQ